MISKNAEPQHKPIRNEPSAGASANAFLLPRSLYAFLAILIASYVLPPLVKQITAAAAADKPNTQPELSDSDFARYVSAESNVRTAFSIDSEADTASEAASLTSLLSVALGDNRKTLLRSARDDYDAIARAAHAPNMDRRILILDHALNRPLDANLLEHRLRPDLHQAGRTSGEIAAELALWESIYGGKQVSASDAAKGDLLIRSMDLRFLQARAQVDLWSAARNASAKTAAERRLRATAAAFIRGEAAVSGLYVIAFLIGFVLLIVFASAAISGDWRRVRRVATAPLHLLWGDLLDAFVFYLALYRFAGFAAGLVLRLSGAALSAHGILLLEAGMQIATGATAVAYLAMKARQRGVTLAEIGLTARGSVFREIGYGVAGYLAGMPLVIVAGLVSRAVFQSSTNTTPNPILPLIVGVHDPISRSLIFLMASVAAPFFEETFFRGALFTGLRTRYGWSLSALISAACFAVVHPVQDWLPIFALGFSFATMREMRQSLVPSMTAHFLQNTLTFAALSSLFSS